MELGERKKKILQAIIDTYVETAEPVGSRALSRHSDIDLSPATLRNEMADLEEMGLLEQPHTSAGRVPSTAGYRLYVDSLMQRYRLTIEEIEQMNRAMQRRFSELDRMMVHAGEMMSRLTNYTTITSTPTYEQAYIKKVELIPLDATSFLFVLLISGDVIKNRLFRSSAAVSAEELSDMCVMMNDALCGRTVSSITWESLLALERDMGSHSDLAEPMIRFASETLRELTQEDLHVSGAKRILSQPEFRDLEKASRFIDLLDDGEELHSLIKQAKDDNMRIIIGDESALLRTHDASIILCRYDAGDNVRGVMGIIGPVRMDYPRIVSSLEYFAQNVKKLIKNAESEDNKYNGGP